MHTTLIHPQALHAYCMSDSDAGFSPLHMTSTRDNRCKCTEAAGPLLMCEQAFKDKLSTQKNAGQMGGTKNGQMLSLK